VPIEHYKGWVFKLLFAVMTSIVAPWSCLTYCIACTIARGKVRFCEKDEQNMVRLVVYGKLIRQSH
jgi:hypothetical protein